MTTTMTKEAVLNHLKNGGDMTNGPQTIYRANEDRYQLTCGGGCCDSELTEEEMFDYIFDWGYSGNWEIQEPGVI